MSGRGQLGKLVYFTQPVWVCEMKQYEKQETERSRSRPRDIWSRRYLTTWQSSGGVLHHVLVSGMSMVSGISIELIVCASFRSFLFTVSDSLSFKSSIL